LIAGVAFDRNGRANGNMAIEYADLNGDGLLDFVTTTYQDEMPVYYEAIDALLFTDATNVARIDSSLYPHVKWGVGAADFDNDGDNDLFIACGHFLDNILAIDDRTDVKVLNYLLANDGRGKFRNVTASAGSALQVVESSRGAAFDDLDNDGDLDFVVLNINAEATLGRNDLSPEVAQGNQRAVDWDGKQPGCGGEQGRVVCGGEGAVADAGRVCWPRL
jgi:enediyne biosynthesis protein E4